MNVNDERKPTAITNIAMDPDDEKKPAATNLATVDDEKKKPAAHELRDERENWSVEIPLDVCLHCGAKGHSEVICYVKDPYMRPGTHIFNNPHIIPRMGRGREDEYYGLDVHYDVVEKEKLKRWEAYHPASRADREWRETFIANQREKEIAWAASDAENRPVPAELVLPANMGSASGLGDEDRLPREGEPDGWYVPPPPPPFVEVAVRLTSREFYKGTDLEGANDLSSATEEADESSASSDGRESSATSDLFLESSDPSGANMDAPESGNSSDEMDDPG